MLLLFSCHLHVCGLGVHVYLSVCTYTYMGKRCMHVRALGWQRESSPITLHCVHWGRVSHLKPGLTEMAILARQLISDLFLYFPCLYLQKALEWPTVHHTHLLSCGFWACKLNFVFMILLVGTSPNKPPPAAHFFLTMCFSQLIWSTQAARKWSIPPAILVKQKQANTTSSKEFYRKAK